MRILLAITCLCALIAAGCGSKTEPTGSTVRQTFPVEAKDGLNRTVTLTHAPAVIVRLKNAPRRLFGKRWLGVPTQLASATAGAAVLQTLNPDIVVTGPAVTTADSARYVRIAKELGRPLFVMPGGDLATIEIAVDRLGRLTGRPEQGRSIALRLRAIRLDVAKRLRGTQPRTVFVDRGLGASLPRETFLAQLIGRAGGKLVGPSDGSSLTPQQLRKLNPDIYLVTVKSGSTLARLRETPVMRLLTAVQTGRVARVDPARAVTDVGAFAFLRELAKLIHPEAFR